MPAGLRWALGVTDTLFIAYWLAAGLDAVGVIAIPADWLYADAHDRRVVAWNWSFLPLDVAFSVTGLFAIRLAQRGDPLWRPMALVSLVLTMVAGGMAVSYWTLLGEFDPAWYLPNLALVIWPMFYIGMLLRPTSADPSL
ncbi:MAG: DUF5360 family protein [Hyphomonadaceae bacterium]|nr:DUF5360 family protein [Hyphomonadaceae bacterium]